MGVGGTGLDPSAPANPSSSERPAGAEAAPYQPWAAKKVVEAFNRRGIDDPTTHCLPPGLPRANNVSLFPIQIVHTPQQVVFLYEYMSLFRVIPLNAKHPDDLLPSYMGNSVGRWEGDTLVVDVIGFNDKTWLAGAGTFHSDALHITERYTRVDKDQINYDVTMEDPKVLTKPWTHALNPHAPGGDASAGIRLRREQSGPGALREAPEGRRRHQETVARYQARSIALSGVRRIVRTAPHDDLAGVHAFRSPMSGGPNVRTPCTLASTATARNGRAGKQPALPRRLCACEHARGPAVCHDPAHEVQAHRGESAARHPGVQCAGVSRFAGNGKVRCQVRTWRAHLQAGRRLRGCPVHSNGRRQTVGDVEDRERSHRGDAGPRRFLRRGVSGRPAGSG